jgi:hypothetical protein
MDHRQLLVIVVTVPILLAGAAIAAFELRWLAFVGQAISAIGTAVTLLPAAVIAARMLRALPQGQLGGLSTLTSWLQRVAQEPQRWHYWLLIAGLALVLAGGIVSTVANWPNPP